MATTPEPLDPSFQISLPAFEGPLDLLLHLIKAHELDILDLPIAFVTERYLSYVSLMEKLNLDIASEYLVMSATLAHIKSKMLLPQEPADQEDEEQGEEIDPRAELIRRLLEYQKYKLAAEQLGTRGIAGRDVFGRGSEAPEASGPAPMASIGLFALLDAFNKVLERARADLAFQITAEGVSIQDRMRQLTELLSSRSEVTFEQLFEGQASIYDLVVTFLALLEMAKRRLCRIYQADPHSPIHLRSTVLAAEGESDAKVEQALDEASLERDEALDRSSGIDRDATRDEPSSEDDTSVIEKDRTLDRDATLEARELDPDESLEEQLDRDDTLVSRIALETPGFDDEKAFDRDATLERWDGIAPEREDEIPKPEAAPAGPSVFDGFGADLDEGGEQAQHTEPDDEDA